MKRKILLVFITIQVIGMVTASAQNGATNIEIQSDNVNISASKDINLSSAKAYYNNSEIAVKGDASRGATVVIAASNASEKSRSGADYICTGNNDQEVFNIALQSLPECGGLIQLTEGDFHFYNVQHRVEKDVTIQGYGSSTVIHRHFVHEPGKTADSMLRAHHDKNYFFKDFTINSNNKQVEGQNNNYDIFCWTPDTGKAEGCCTIENVHVINGMCHNGSDHNTIAFFVTGANARIINCTVQGENYTRSIHVSPVNKTDLYAYVVGCITDSSIEVRVSNSFISKNKTTDIFVNSIKQSIVTENMVDVLKLGGYRVYAGSNICNTITNQTSNSLVTNNLVLP